MAGKRWNVNPRFVICEDQAAVNAIVAGFYPIGTIMYRQDTELFYKWNGSTWVSLAFNSIGPVTGKKKGIYSGVSATGGEGLLNGLTLVGTAVGNDIDYTNNTGSYFTFRTAASLNANAGHKQTAFIASRELNSIFGTKILPISTSNNRIFSGLKATTGDLPASSDDPLAALNGIGIMKRSTDTTWQIISNGWNANSQYINTTVPISNVNPTSIMIRALETSAKWQYSIDLGVNWIDIIGNIPVSDTRQCYINEIQSVDGSAQDLRIYATEIVSDK